MREMNRYFLPWPSYNLSHSLAAAYLGIALTQTTFPLHNVIDINSTLGSHFTSIIRGV